MMAKDDAKIKADLASYGITDVNEVFHNISYEKLYEHEMDPSLEGFAKGFFNRYRCCFC